MLRRKALAALGAIGAASAGGLRDAGENTTTEPEGDDPDAESGTVEPFDEIQIAHSAGAIDGNPSGFTDNGAGFDPVEQYSLREFLNRISDGPGAELSAGTMNAEQGGETVHEVSVVWWLPIDHGSQVQSDSVRFDFASVDGVLFDLES